MAIAGSPGFADTLRSFDRAERVRRWSRRRAARARLACAAAALAVAGCAREVSAGVLVAQAASESQALGMPATSAASATSAAGEVVRLAGALAVVLALAFAVRWWVRRTGMAGLSGGGAFEVVARHPMGRGQQVLVARFGPRVLLLQQGRDGLRTLSEVTDPREAEALAARARGGADVPVHPSERTVDLRRGKDGGA